MRFVHPETDTSGAPPKRMLWFNEAVEACSYNFGQLDTTVRIKYWDDPLPGNPWEFAAAYQFGDVAEIRIKTDLDDEARPGDEGGYPPGTYAGKAFFQEVVIHELGHVVQRAVEASEVKAGTSNSGDWRKGVCALFGQPLSAWSSPSDPWEQRVEEAVAEWFKVIFTDEVHRKFGNRTALWLYGGTLQDAFVTYFTVVQSSPHSRKTPSSSKDKTRRRKDRPVNHWHGQIEEYTIGRSQFRLRIFEGKRHQDARPPKPWTIDDAVETLTWTEGATGAVSGTVTLRKPFAEAWTDRLAPGTLIRCDQRSWGTGNWHEAWRMRVLKPTLNIDVGQHELEVADDLNLLQRSEDDFDYGKGKSGGGWYAHDIASDVARRYRLSGTFARGTEKVTVKQSGISPLEAIQSAYDQETKKTGVEYVIQFRRGRLVVHPIRPSPVLLRLGSKVITAAIEVNAKSVVTAVTARAAPEKAKAKSGSSAPKAGHGKILATVESPGKVARYGYVHKNITVKATSEADARTEARQQLARLNEPRFTATFTHPGIIGAHRGDAIRLNFPEERFAKLCWISEIQHNVDASGHTMDVTVSFRRSPYDQMLVDIEKKKKAAARKRGRHGSTSTPTQATTGRARRRRDAQSGGTVAP